jgi:glycosyltransferase involved in cell wall biosynthesis
MPSLNEAEFVGTCIGKAQQFLSLADISGGVLIADNGSTDGSRAIAEKYVATHFNGVASWRRAVPVIRFKDQYGAYNFNALPE